MFSHIEETGRMGQSVELEDKGLEKQKSQSSVNCSGFSKFGGPSQI
ncbi:hypothetical protein [Vibrio splendidus]|nr:hypothetical protein [Vibrio splendidus]